ncbi:hypothetical protein ACTFIR_007525 [Dictyostelium discoideum]
MRELVTINRKKNFGDCCTFSNSYVQQGYGNISKWSTTQPNITKKGVSSILELTSLDDTTSQVCLVRHLATYLRASKERRKTHSLLQYFDDLFVHSKLDYIVYFFKIIRTLLRHIENYAQNYYNISKESKKKNKKTLSDESLKEFNIKKGFECENIVDFLIERHYSTPIDVEKVKATTDIPIHSDNYNLNNCSFHLYCNVRDKELSLSNIW